MIDFFKSEVISGFDCDMCKKKNVKVEKSSELWLLPKVFIMTISRFFYDVNKSNFSKKDDKIKLS